MNTSELIQHDIQGKNGPWLVFIHGLTCDRTDWSEQLAALRDSFCCLSVDTRGHGESADMPPPYNVATDAADLVRLLEHHGVTNAILVGHSRGVRVATAAAAMAPHTTGALVMVDGSQQGTGNPEAARKQIFDRIESSPSVDAFITEMFGAMFPEGTPGRGRDAIEKRAVNMRKAVFLELIGDMVRFDAGQFEDQLASLQQPVGVVQSTTINAQRERRSLQPGEMTPFLEMIEDTCGEAQLLSVPNMGHFVQLDAPETVTDMIRTMATRIRH